MCFSCHCLGQHGFAGARRVYQQSSLGQFCTDLGIFLWIMQEVHDFHQRFLCFVFTGHILECNAGLLLYIYLGIALAHAHGSAASAHSAEQKTCHDPDQYHRQYHGYQNLHQEIGSIAGHAIPLNIMLLQSGCQGIQILHQHCIIYSLGLCHLLGNSIEADITARCRGGCSFLLQLYRHHAAFLIYLHRSNLVRFQILQEIGIRYFRSGIGAEERIIQHQYNDHCHQSRQDQHQDAGALR